MGTRFNELQQKQEELNQSILGRFEIMSDQANSQDNDIQSVSENLVTIAQKVRQLEHSFVIQVVRVEPVNTSSKF